MDNILEKLKKKNFPFMYGLKAIVWLIFWGKLKKKFFLLFPVDLYYKAIVWVIFC
jgi:hypothetical protein